MQVFKDFSVVGRRQFLDRLTALAVLPWFAGARPCSVLAEDKVQPGGNWFKDVYRLLHVDAHFDHFTTEIFKDFDADFAAKPLEIHSVYRIQI